MRRRTGMRTFIRAACGLGLPVMLAAPLPADADAKAKAAAGRPAPSAKMRAKGAGPQKGARANPPAGAELSTRAVLASFAPGDPGWKLRMRSLVSLANAGPAAVPALVDALDHGSASTREFACQALAIIGAPAARPSLTRALEDPERGVRVYALRALSRLGSLQLTDPQRHLLAKDSGPWMPDYVEFAETRADPGDPAALRPLLAGYDLAAMDTARLGRLAPDFVLTDILGNTHRLSQFRGKKTVVLEFNPGDG
jgi:hypothetical protein